MNIFLHLRVNGTVDYDGEGWLQNVPSDNEDNPGTRRTPHGQSYASIDDTDMFEARVGLINEYHMNAPFPYNVPGIEQGLATIEDSKDLYISWDSHMALSLTG